MDTVSAIRHSGLARKGLLALVVLAYLVYVAGSLLEVLRQGFDQLLTAFPYVEIGVATVGLVVAGLLIRWFFVTEPAVDVADGEPGEDDEGERVA